MSLVAGLLGSREVTTVDSKGHQQRALDTRETGIARRAAEGVNRVTAAGFEPLLIESARVLMPLRRALEDADQFATFLGRFGHAPDQEKLEAGWDALAGLRANLDGLFDDLATLPPPAELTPDHALQLAGRVQVAFSQVRTAAAAGGELHALGLTDLAGELIDVLLDDHLRDRAPIALDILRALGVLESVELLADAPDGRDIDAVLPRFRWVRLRQLVTDTDAWAQDVYGWGEEFDADLAITRVVAVLDWVGPPSTIEPMSDVQVADLVRNHPEDAPNPLLARAPLIGTDLTEPSPADAAATLDEAGLVLMPFGDVDQPDGFGLALAPYGQGGVAADTQLTNTLSLLVDVDASATGGAVLALTPDGLSLEGEASAQATFELGLRLRHPDDQPIPLIGSPDGTRLEIGGAMVSLGGTLGGTSDAELFLAGGVEQLRAVIDLREDGFLGSLVPEPIVLDAGDVLAGWRPSRGIYFEGGTNLTVLVPLDLDLHALHVRELGIELLLDDPIGVALTLDAAARIGPLFAAVEGLGLRASLHPAADDDGVLGAFDIEFSLTVPSGYAVVLDGGVIVGGGLLSADDGGYRGALALSFGEIGFNAFGLLKTEIPDGEVSFSFVASIFGEFTLPLGFGFFLTGIGGIVGIHRRVDTGALREVLYEGRLDDQLFPEDPIANADTILDDMDAIYPVAPGQHLFGPIARVSWGQPALVEGTLGVILEVGTSLRVLILGSLSSVLPSRDVPLLELHLAFFGEIDFAAETIELDATLSNSRVLTYGIAGEMALRSGWARGIDHVMSFGGLHPDYPRPDNLPDLQRLSISLGNNNPRVSLFAYLAVTVGSLQLGARASIYVKGPQFPLVGRISVEGSVYFDALIFLNPFGFDVSLGGSLEVLVNGTPRIEAAFDLRLRGPNRFKIDGKAWARIAKVRVSVSVSHRWGDPQTLPEVSIEPAELLREALEAADGFDGLGTSARSSGVSFVALDGAERRPADPAGGLRLTQRAVPLDVTIEKVGEAVIAGGAASFDMRLNDDTGLHVRDATQEFARAQFYELTDAERLRTPSFERWKAGLEIVANELRIDDQAAIEATHDYEVIVIEPRDEDPDPGRIIEVAELSADFVARWSHQGVAGIATPKTRQRAVAADTIRVIDAVRGGVVPDRGETVLVDEMAVVDDTDAGSSCTAGTTMPNVLHGQPAHAAYVLAAAGLSVP